MSIPARLIALLIVLAATAPARAGFITYTFTSDSSESGGSLAGSFRVDELDLLDGLLTRTDVQNYQFSFTDSSGGTTLFTLGDVVPELAVDPTTGIPIGPIGFVLGEQVGGDGIAQADLTADALASDTSFWQAISLPTGATDTGRGHWTIAPEGANPVPAPASVVLGLVGAGCLAIGRRMGRLRVK
jgi:hypothetical protein